MCRSSAQGGRRCTGHQQQVKGPAAGVRSQFKLAYPGPGGNEGFPERSRGQFLATSVKGLVRVEDGGVIHVAPKPKGMSEKAYRAHLAGRDRLELRVRDASTRDLPERLWGGAVFRGLDVESARVVANSSLGKGQLVSARWVRISVEEAGR
jgi:hypothetical protein